MKNVPKLLDALRDRLQIQNDAALARALGISAPQVCKLRGGATMGPAVILKIHERTKIPVGEIRELAK